MFQLTWMLMAASLWAALAVRIVTHLYVLVTSNAASILTHTPSWPMVAFSAGCCLVLVTSLICSLAAMGDFIFPAASRQRDVDKSHIR